MHPVVRALSGLLSRFASLRHAIGRVSRFPVAAHSRLMAAPCAALRNTTPKEESLAEWGCAEVPPTRPCNGGQYRSPTPNAPLRKEVEREAGDPEGNLVIVERVGRKRQHHFSCREYGWVGSAHRFASTQQRALFLKVNATIPLGG